jgi:hypothetical protein
MPFPIFRPPKGNFIGVTVEALVLIPRQSIFAAICTCLNVHQVKKIALSSIDIQYGGSCVYSNNA